ncbi:MAG: hypothetical protein QOE36_1150 [Gaiellaceae bacterium]|nr:hypothetical protein [Gaiellaceae bacterium]
MVARARAAALAKYDRRMERFDVAIVGAGPAGSTAAYRLAHAGARVLLVDRACFPRDKPCGGGLTVRALKQLPFSVEPVVEDEIHRVRMRFRRRRGFERSTPHLLAAMTQRRRLDHFLVQQAAGAGAELREGVKVGAIEPHGNRVELTVDGVRVTAAALLGADGVNGIVARWTGLDQAHRVGVALEGNLAYGGAVTKECYRGTMVLELGDVPGGYGWIFPKGDHVNLGVGGWGSEGPRLRAHLEQLCAAYGVDSADLTEVRGYRLPMRRALARPARGRVALIGDAAGLVDPLSGDGMYEAFVSSRLVTDAVLDLLAGRAESLEPYADRIVATLAPNAAASWSAKVAVDRFPRLVFAILWLPPFWSVLERLVRGEIGHPGEARGAARAPVRLVRALARRAGDLGRAYRAEAAA